MGIINLSGQIQFWRGGGGGGVPTFSPLSLSPILWLDCSEGLYKDAAKAQPATAENDLIYTWADMSGNGRDMIQSNSAVRPKLAADGSVKFEQKRLDRTFDVPRPVEIYLLINYVHNDYGGIFGGSGHYAAVFTASGVLSLIMRDNGDVYKNIGVPSREQAKIVIRAIFDGSNSFLSVNGGVRYTVSGFASPVSSSPFVLGASPGIVNPIKNMNVYELLMYPALTNPQRYDVLDYLVRRWSVTI